MTAVEPKQCYHCALPIPAGGEWSTVDPHKKNSQTLYFCCPACQAVYECIHDNGFDQYYRLRQEAASKAEGLADYTHFDLFSGDSDFIDAYTNEGKIEYRAQLVISGVHCSACAWLIETRLQKMRGVSSVQMNLQRRQLAVQWRVDQLSLSKIMAVIAQLGYQPSPWSSASRQAVYEQEKNGLLRRLGVSGLVMMQVGMLSLGLYAGDWQGMDASIRDLLRMASGLLTSLALLYCASPFFSSAWRSLHNRSVNMDVPVAIALSTAYGASVYASLIKAPHIYFDTVCMFVFFLLLSRWIEVRSREPKANAANDLLPLTAQRRINTNGNDGDIQYETVPLARLNKGDIVLCTVGEKVPADGVIVEGESSFDESAFTGESIPAVHRCGQHVLAGSVNVEQSVWVQVQATAANASISQIEKLLDDSMLEKPDYAKMIDRFSPWFVAIVLLCAVATALFWAVNDPSKLLSASLAVLIVSCPCALSLATPVAIAVANTRLRESGILPVSSRLLERLPSVSHIVFDKTGTLTQGQLALKKIQTFGLSEQEAFSLAASLEQVSQHPIANALRDYGCDSLRVVCDAKVYIGFGVAATIDDKSYRIGSPTWCAELYGGEVDVGADFIELADSQQALARFYFDDPLRADAKATLGTLQALGYHTALMSGDAASRVAMIAQDLTINQAHAELSPNQKLAAVNAMQAQGAVVLMVGDGVNDAPVLAAADVSLAMTNASDLSKSKADGILLSSHLHAILWLISLAKRCRRVVYQNIVWAAAYNAITIPLAAAGILPPWLAAIGMSLSSLIVVLNSQQLAARSKANQALTCDSEEKRLSW